MSYVDLPKVQPGTAEAERKILSFLADIKSRKEFFELNYDDTDEGEHFMRRFLQMHGPQLFVKNFLNLDTPYKRLFVNWQTGTGKTIAALGIAKEFASRVTNAGQKKKVFIIGFTKTLFVGELLSHPYFGFITYDELDRINKLKEHDAGTVEYKKYTDMMTQLKRRITDKGYQKFYGYKELATKLFMRTDKAMIERFDWKTLFATTILKKDAFLENLQKEIKGGNIRINQTLLESMKDSLVIADEIHNLYNMQTENNYGIALQYILDTLGSHAPYTVLMSATPMTGAASEIVDLLNLLIEPRFLPEGRHLRKEDFFSGGDYSALKEGALEKIGHLAAGRVSFLIDMHEGKYPRRIFAGQPDSSVPYLKLTKCVMSDFQQKTLCSVEGQPQGFLYDFAFPIPESPDRGANTVVEYRQTYTSEQKALAKMGVNVIDHGNDFYVSGPFLQLDKLAKYSAKYHAMMDLVLKLMRTDTGKIMVFHPRVHSSGVLLIQEIFRQNGFIDESASPVDSTLCSICGVPKKEHGRKTGKGGNGGDGGDDALPELHAYMPARFITLHSGLDANAMAGSIDKFNMLNNLYGHRFRVVIGARVIREGLNFKAVRHQIIMSLPDNYPTLIQVHGRCIRRGSALELPEHLRSVTIHHLVSDSGPSGSCESEVSRYAKKGDEYKLIQQVTRMLRVYSIDGFLSYPRLQKTIPGIASDSTLDFLPFVNKDAPSKSPQFATYYAYGYGQREVAAVMNVIWVLFSMLPVWHYDDLWQVLHEQHGWGRPFQVPSFGYNLKTVSKETFDLALYYLSGKRNTLGGALVYTIFRCGEYLILCHVAPTGEPIVSPEIYLREKLSKSVQTRISIPVTTSNVPTASTNDLLAFVSSAQYPELALLSFPAKAQVELLESLVRKSALSAEEQRASDVYQRFGILLTGDKIAKNKRAAELLPNDFPSDGKQPLGFIYKSSVIVWAGGELRHLPAKLFVKTRSENKVVVGFTELMHGGTELVFKIRESVSVKKSDLRKMPRGGVCQTRGKPYLMKVIRRLTPLLADSKAWKGKVVDLSKTKTVNLCTAIRLMLLSLEEDARKTNSDDLFLYLLEDS